MAGSRRRITNPHLLAHATADRLTRILIIGNERLRADAVEALLRHQADMTVVGNTLWLPETAFRAVALQPDIIIIDFNLDDRTAVDAATAIWRAGFTAGVIFLSDCESDSVLLAAIEAGASAVVCENRAAAEMIGVVRAVAHGAFGFPAGIVARVVSKRRLSFDGQARVTHRERQILALIAKGLANREIAARAGISYVTVRTHVRNLANKLGAHSKLEVLAKARQLDLIPDWPGHLAFQEAAETRSTPGESVILPIESRVACA